VPLSEVQWTLSQNQKLFGILIYVRQSIIFLLGFNFGIGVPAVETPSGPLTLSCYFYSKLEYTRQEITELEGPEEFASTVRKTVTTNKMNHISMIANTYDTN
jgi:hypothetical protein